MQHGHSKSQYRLKIITKVKITVQITCKIAGNLRFIFDCNIALKFGGGFATKISIKMIYQS